MSVRPEPILENDRRLTVRWLNITLCVEVVYSKCQSNEVPGQSLFSRPCGRVRAIADDLNPTAWRGRYAVQII
jgi:hypothetical protein